jgi:hypothetical protein
MKFGAARELHVRILAPGSSTSRGISRAATRGSSMMPAAICRCPMATKSRRRSVMSS